MNKSKYYHIGLDTSNYTTSVAIVDSDKNIVFDNRIVLSVKPGERGLRQNEAIFQHINNVPILINKTFENFDKDLIKSIGYSSKPRNLIGSYMPTFNVGTSCANIISKTLDIPLFQFSHQDGHIEAALIDHDFQYHQSFVAFHISGGTTEILNIANFSKEGFNNEIIGGSKDISFGQLIDRIGVTLGFNFPCGKYMEEYLIKKTAESMSKEFIENNIKENIKQIHSENNYVNLSGMENYFNKLISSSNIKTEDVIAKLFLIISDALIKQIQYSLEVSGLSKIVLSGGVFANSYIRKYIQEANINDCDIYFGDPNLCSDNAVGIALLSSYRYNTEVLINETN
jgi:N6-L-threonylcarbamoyladenine synthase